MHPRGIGRLLIVVPNWVGDVVLASPVLAAVRDHFPSARITLLLRRYLADVVDGGDWHDQLRFWPDAKADGGPAGLWWLVAEMRKQQFDAALLLTNSFKSALVAYLAGARRRVGYAREYRGWMLTDQLAPLKRGGKFVPTPMFGYYAAIAERIGCPVIDGRLRLGVTPAQEAAGTALQTHYGLGPGVRYAVINPGAAFGAAKCWLPERFAEVCDQIEHRLGWRAVIVGGPSEFALMRRIAEQCRKPPIVCANPGTTLGSLKVIIRDAALLVCNDTGPRHYGNAFGVPTVTIFGPTHQEWTDTGYAGERKLQIKVPCGPCQLRVCPLDHACMKRITPEMVMAAVERIAVANTGN